MRIELRFGLILAACFVFGVAVTGYISYTLEFRQAQAQVNEKSRVLLEMGLALRNYTSTQIAPLVTELGFAEFHPQMVPSYGAQTTLAALQQRFPDFRYRESSLNPTAIEDRATDWEVGLLRAFQADPELKELSGETGRAAAQHFYIARPLKMPSTDCLQCHSTPEVAPASMVTHYGNNGFGWKMGDVIGMQLVEVPVAGSNAQALKGLLVTLGSLSCVLVLTFSIFLLLLRRYVTHPLEAIIRNTRQTSLGGDELPRGTTALNGQFRDLEQSIKRLRLSLDEALRLFPALSGRTKPER